MLATCPVCAAAVETAAPFCANCGLALRTVPPRPLAIPAPAAPARRCPHCGAPAREHARACVLCGRALQRAPALVARPLRPGRLLGGRYAVERMLSKGGMGAIYLAADRQTGRLVVVKALTDYFDTTDMRQVAAARERLAQEAATLAQLDHPCIPHTLGAIDDGAQLYLVMEHIAGPNLERQLSHAGPNGEQVAGRPYALANVLRWGVTLCRVLEYLAARPRPVIHHDIKPANVLVDGAGDAVYLVDFGTAQIRLDPGGGVGLEQSSLYGTVGYAPPEQYRGHSEPRSDVYALAATLYHLASDDDPADHPFSFPRLESLGALGAALRDALEGDVARRPHAAELRRRLEQLLAHAGAALLRAPDGTWLRDQRALVGWCLREWDRAAAWLREGLPEQIERWWGDAALADELDQVVEQAPDHHMALDQALALLDPSGVGQGRPMLTCDTPEVDFGSLPGSVLRRDIAIENVGQRHVTLYVFVPRWLGGTSGTLVLPPGRRTVLSLAPDLSRVYLGGRLRGEVLVRDHYGRRAQDVPLLRVPVRAHVPRRHILRRYGLPLGGAGLALLLWAGADLPLPQPPAAYAPLPAQLAATAPEPPAGDVAATLRAAEDALARGNFQAARTTLIGHLQRHGESPAVRALLNDVFYREAERLLAEGNWEGSRAALQALLAIAPDYRGAHELLAETYRAAAQAALDRGDLAGARADLERLLDQSGDTAGDAALYRRVLERLARDAAAAGDWSDAAAAVRALRDVAPADAPVDELLRQFPQIRQVLPARPEARPTATRPAP